MDITASPKPGSYPYAFAHGSWGDVFAQYALWRRVYPRFGFIYAWPDPAIRDWLLLQSEIAEAICVPTDNWLDHHALKTWIRTESARGQTFPDCLHHPQAWIARFLAEKGIEGMPPGRVGHADTGSTASLHLPLQRFTDPVLPDSIRATARARVAALRNTKVGAEKRFLLVQPYSAKSGGVASHWTGWQRAWDWLSAQPGVTLLLVGQPLADDRVQWDLRGRHLDWRGQTDSMMDVFALADEVDGVVTTCNSLSMWTAATGKRAVVLASANLGNRTDYYRRWITHPVNRLLHKNALLWQFAWTVRGHILKGTLP